MSLYRSHPQLYAWLKNATDDFSHDYDAMLGWWSSDVCSSDLILHTGVPVALALAILAFVIAVFRDFLATY